ncbi:MAG: M23 family metallopeptidase [Myxococcales bacterium]|nr:M23 family metallopeptidase [Myxococcales bacterium]
MLHRTIRQRRIDVSRATAAATHLVVQCSIAAVLLLAVDACDGDGGATTPPDPVIPADHPCPDRALPPREPSLWLDALASGAPVPLAMALPVPPGEAVRVTQGHEQLPTHVGVDAFAWDFDVPVGTVVRAGAPGVVVYVRDDSDRFGADASYQGDANFVVVDVGGGLYTTYVHLARGSARVGAGDVVSAGDALADTGLSGRMTGPHLHMHVENAWSQSVPAAFVDPVAGGCELDPDEGDDVVADAASFATLVGRGAVTAIAADAFADLGVLEADGLPGRLVEAGRAYRVSGRVAASAAQVVALLLPEDGGSAVATVRMAAKDGRFSGTLRLDAPPGRYGLALAAAEAGQAVSVPAAIRVTVE